MSTDKTSCPEDKSHLIRIHARDPNLEISKNPTIVIYSNNIIMLSLLFRNISDTCSQTTFATNCGAMTRYRRRSRRGPLSKRCSHSKQEFCIQEGHLGRRPLRSG